MHNPLYQQVADRVRADISRNVFGGVQLPKEAELLDRYSVSKVTMHRAMQVLAREGTIDRVHGKGSFIRDRKREMTMARQIGVLMGTRGHFHTPLYDAVIGRIIDEGYYGVTMSYEAPKIDAEQPLERIERLHGLLASPIRGVIASGAGYGRYPFMRDYEDVDAVFMLGYEGKDPMPGKGVFADYAGAVELGMTHLRQLGHRRIGLVTYLSVESATVDPDDRAEAHADTTFQQSYARQLAAMADPVVPRVLYYASPDEHPEDRFVQELSQLLRQPDRPTALLCTADIYALRTFAVVTDAGLRVPEDIAILGMYNTPWCGDTPVPLSSIDFQPELIGQTAVDLLLTKRPYTGRPLVIPPKLVIRQSCGGTL